MVFDQNDIISVKEQISKAESITIISHKSPDGDSIGSSVALAGYLSKITAVPITILAPDQFPDFLRWMDGSEKVILGDNKPELATESLNRADLIFVLDFNNAARVGDKLQGPLTESSAFKIMFDHHRDPDGFCDVTFSDITASSTCQLIYEFVVAMGDQNKIDRAIAEAIYCGIVMDTGSFKFSSTTTHTHTIAADLLSRGVRNSFIHEKIFDSNSVDRVKLLGYTLNKMEVFKEFKVAILSLTSEEMLKFNCRKGDTEGFVNFALSMEGIEMAAFFKEAEGIVKISFRSKGNFHVNELSNQYFNGGGHKNAAGGSSKENLVKTIEKFKSLFPELVKYYHD